MLAQLSIKNYALIRDLEIEFNSGFTVITGETGAGKSILLGALNLVLGKRADTSVLMDKTKKCVVEAIFRISGYNLNTIFIHFDLDYDDSTIIRREISASGKSRAFINDTPVNLSVLKEITESLINIHSQDQTNTIGKTDFQMAVVDSFAGITGEYNKYRQTYRQFTKLQSELSRFEEQERSSMAEKDYFRFLVDELNSAGLKAGEQEELEQELEILNHTEEIKSVLFECASMLEGDESGLIQGLTDIKSKFAKIAPYKKEFGELHKRIDSSLIDLKDISLEISKAEESILYQPGRTEEINDRLNILNSLQQKHRVTCVEELLTLQNEFEEKLKGIESLSGRIDYLRKELESKSKEISSEAVSISKKRESVFNKIETEITGQLHLLGMPDANFKINHQKLPQPGPDGFDQIRFMFNANKGGALTVLEKVASGGEKSRLMLALKSLISQKNLLPTIIFDEIDSGVSGAVAEKVGDILLKLASNMQVITITHLPQIAGKGNDHLLVYKVSGKQYTSTEIRRLEREERVLEIAKLVSGHEVTTASVESAKQLLKN